MATLRQISSKIESILNHGLDHAAKERVKDSFKNIISTRIRQSVERNGLTSDLKSTTGIDLVEDVGAKLNGFHVYSTIAPIPSPVRFKNDSPFTFVGTVDGIPFSHKSLIEIKQSVIYGNKGFKKFYIYNRLLNKITIFISDTYSDFKIDINNYTKLVVQTIFNNPEEALAYYSDQDTQDMELPFPDDMIQSVILEILKTEFSIEPKELEIEK